MTCGFPNCIAFAFAGAKIFIVPSCFTFPTDEAHWESLTNLSKTASRPTYKEVNEPLASPGKDRYWGGHLRPNGWLEIARGNGHIAVD